MTTSKPFSHGTRASVQIARRPDSLPDTGRDTSNNSRLLLPNTTQTTNRVRRRPGPRWKDQSIKDEELRTLLRKKGYRVLELFYDSYSDKKRDELYRQILASLGI